MQSEIALYYISAVSRTCLHLHLASGRVPATLIGKVGCGQLLTCCEARSMCCLTLDFGAPGCSSCGASALVLHCNLASLNMHCSRLARAICRRISTCSRVTEGARGLFKGLHISARSHGLFTYWHVAPSDSARRPPTPTSSSLTSTRTYSSTREAWRPRCRCAWFLSFCLFDLICPSTFDSLDCRDTALGHPTFLIGFIVCRHALSFSLLCALRWGAACLHLDCS